ncbi:LacI family DNA-binding transcriptional regulator [Brevibacillus migulae]|uniref:LacI family DNA-binding transcriptional regulator n=1 Tax=Brevibacillus migulae TaxID=1644114 RepID=UPI00106EE168|nr:LacI family DNA-binding transcriptional regulator [Brevibacillus migulae]
MKPTIYDVAREAGVSITTVSKIINGKGRISIETQKKVLHIMEQLNYQPSLVATALTGKGTRTIGLLIPDLANPFFAELARSVEDRGHEHGFSVIICSSDNNEEKMKRYIAMLQQKCVDGMIIATGIGEQVVEQQLLPSNMPIALIARDMPGISAQTVLVDDFAGGYLAATHLIELGHTRIGILTEPLHLVSSLERLRGYRQALADHQLSFSADFHKQSDSRIEKGKEKASEWFQRPGSPTAIFASNDLLAIGVMQAARDAGLRVPEDVSVVGFDNTILAEISDPPLTTIAQPIEHMGHQVIDYLVQVIVEDEKEKQRVVIQPELVVRKSTAAPSGREGSGCI